VPGVTSEQITKVISGNSSPLSHVGFDGCVAKDFLYANINTLATERYLFSGTSTADATVFGAPEFGQIPLLPMTTTAQSNVGNIPFSGGLFFDYDLNKLKLNRFGTIYEVPLRTSNNFGTFELVASSSTLVGSQTINISALVGNMFIVCVTLGGNSGENFGYMGMLSSFYSVDKLTQISAAGLTASLSEGVISVTGAGPFYGGVMNIYRLA